MPPERYTSLAIHTDNQQKSRLELIAEYYRAGCTQLEICALLYSRHAITLSIRHLNRLLREADINHMTDMEQLIAATEQELSGSGAYLGCRSMARRLLSKYNIRASRSLVSQIQHELDPLGVENRRQHRLHRRVYQNGGPNFGIHLDGYDKLKPYGFAIHGCIDGFSRRVLWLKVGNTNNDPAIVASYFINFIKEIKAVPRLIQMDEGTENVTIIDIQKAFRWYHTDDMSGENSVRTGSSHSNQRIERWWLTQRMNGIAFWIDRFKDLVHTGKISTSNHLQIECLRFCVMELIQKELDQISMDWNQHRIRNMRHAECPSGKPDIMYYSPELYGAHDYKFPVCMDDVAEAGRLVTKCPLERGCSQEFCELCTEVMEEHGKQLPESVEQAFELYDWLLERINA